MIELRPADVRDVPTIARLINDSAELGLMLPKSLAVLYENVREFHVAVDTQKVDGDADQVLGVCGLSIVWADLSEIVSLVVSPQARGQGLGGKLVQKCLDEARRLHIRRVMTLTYERGFFERQGFAVVDRQNLPLKVWSECVRCPKNQACDEIAMMYELQDVPVVEAARPTDPPPQKYVVPVTLSALRRESPN